MAGLWLGRLIAQAPSAVAGEARGTTHAQHSGEEFRVQPAFADCAPFWVMVFAILGNSLYNFLSVFFCTPEIR